MARIKIDLPDRFGFSTTVPVRSSDVNQAGHVGWDSMFRILDEAGVQFWRTLDDSPSKEERISRITVDAGINYKQQAYHGQTLKVEVAADEFSDKGFDLIYRVTDAGSGTEIARAKTGILWFDYQKQKVVSIPEELRNKLLKR